MSWLRNFVSYFSENKTTRRHEQLGAVLTPLPSCTSGCGRSAPPLPPLLPHRSIFTCAPPPPPAPPPTRPTTRTSTLVSNFDAPAPDSRRPWRYSLKLTEALTKSKGKEIVLQAETFVELTRIRALSCGMYGKHCYSFIWCLLINFITGWITGLMIIYQLCHLQNVLSWLV